MDGYIKFFSSTVGIGVGLIGYIIVAISLMAMAKRVGMREAWMAWVPILNLVVMAKIAQRDIFWVILMLIPCVNIIPLAIVWWRIAERMGKPGPVGLLCFVPILGILIPPYLAFSD